MKRLLLLLVFCLLALSVSAQSHIFLGGITLNGPVEQVVDKLKGSGYEVLKIEQDGSSATVKGAILDKNDVKIVFTGKGQLHLCNSMRFSYSNNTTNFDEVYGSFYNAYKILTQIYGDPTVQANYAVDGLSSMTPEQRLQLFKNGTVNCRLLYRVSNLFHIIGTVECKIMCTKGGNMFVRIEAKDNLNSDPAFYDDVNNPMFSNDEMVDLGLSVKWSTCNLGASVPGDVGKYFAYGDVEGQFPGEFGHFNKTFDSKFELDSNNNLTASYDAAHIILGGYWRMPTKADFDELIENCTFKNNGWGVIFTSKKPGYEDKSIFFPFSGKAQQLGFSCATYLFYWSSTYWDAHKKWCLMFNGSPPKTYVESSCGMPIRPVYSMPTILQSKK